MLFQMALTMGVLARSLPLPFLLAVPGYLNEYFNIGLVHVAAMSDVLVMSQGKLNFNVMPHLLHSGFDLQYSKPISGLQQ